MVVGVKHSKSAMTFCSYSQKDPQRKCTLHPVKIVNKFPCVHQNLESCVWILKRVFFVFTTLLCPFSTSASITPTLCMLSFTTTINILPFLLLPDSSIFITFCPIYPHSLLWTFPNHLSLDSLSKCSTWAVLWCTHFFCCLSWSQPEKTLTFSSQWPVFTSPLFLKISQSTLCLNHQTVLMSLVKKPVALSGMSSRPTAFLIHYLSSIWEVFTTPMSILFGNLQPSVFLCFPP